MYVNSPSRVSDAVVNGSFDFGDFVQFAFQVSVFLLDDILPVLPFLPDPRRWDVVVFAHQKVQADTFAGNGKFLVEGHVRLFGLELIDFVPLHEEVEPPSGIVLFHVVAEESRVDHPNWHEEIRVATVPAELLTDDVRFDSKTRHGSSEEPGAGPVPAVILAAEVVESAGCNGEGGGEGVQRPSALAVVISHAQRITDLLEADVIDADGDGLRPKCHVIDRETFLDAALAFGLVEPTEVAHAEETTPSVGILLRRPLEKGLGQEFERHLPL